MILSEEEEDLRMRNEDKGNRRKNEEDAIDSVTLCGLVVVPSYFASGIEPCARDLCPCLCFSILLLLGGTP